MIDIVDYFDISIVVQGAIDSQYTQLCLSSIRQIFPKSEIILSTWEGSDITGLIFDRVVFSKDPGATVADEVCGTLNNVNRQIVSTQAGIKAVSRPYILKTRTDVQLLNSDFLNYFKRYDEYSPPKLVSHRLLVCNYYTRNPRFMGLCYHPSDWILFGCTEDLLLYFDISLQTEEEAFWFQHHQKDKSVFINYQSRLTPEQYIFTNFLSRYITIEQQCYYDGTPDSITQTESAIADCMVVLDYSKHFGIRFMKYNPNRYFEKYSLLSHWQWKACYYHYAKKKAPIIWWLYLLWCSFSRLLKCIRVNIIRFLHVLGMKEWIKKILKDKHI